MRLGSGTRAGSGLHVVVDDVPPEHGKLDPADVFGLGRARLGELPGDPAHLDDWDPRAVGEYDRHLQDDLELVADRVGREVVEGLGAVARLEQKGLSGRDLGQSPGEPAGLAGEHERRLLGELGQGVVVGDRIGPGRLLSGRARPPRGRLPAVSFRLGCLRDLALRARSCQPVACGAHPNSVRGRAGTLLAAELWSPTPEHGRARSLGFVRGRT